MGPGLEADFVLTNLDLQSTPTNGPCAMNFGLEALVLGSLEVQDNISRLRARVCPQAFVELWGAREPRSQVEPKN